MDIFATIVLLYVLYIFIWFVISCLADCDAVTFLSIHFGKSPGKWVNGWCTYIYVA